VVDVVTGELRSPGPDGQAKSPFVRVKSRCPECGSTKLLPWKDKICPKCGGKMGPGMGMTVMWD
jgi:hypothetical protein